jgi:hypothetical protein
MLVDTMRQYAMIAADGMFPLFRVPVRADVDGWRGRHSFKLAVIFSV